MMRGCLINRYLIFNCCKGNASYFSSKNKVVLGRANSIWAVQVCANHFTRETSGSSATNAGIREGM